ncbi:ParB/RepB/Spo0J family partition protein [Enterobacter ludwigii]|uniref:IbrB-like domain-containing protein n=1 Tax=Enterobacter ludwigii TaxID=299767 RepID=UPI003D25F6A2
MNFDIKDLIRAHIESFTDVHEKIQAINQLRILIHNHSPFKKEPADCVLWVENKHIEANNYNPNVMAPVEKRLLAHSIIKNGFTQPIVTAYLKNTHFVVDGFHRQLLGRTKPSLYKRLSGYLPVTTIGSSHNQDEERIAATIRHNRARGKHQVSAMSDIVRDLSRMGWGDKHISEELGMDQDEVLRLKQISGLTELFSDQEFSNAWTID